MKNRSHSCARYGLQTQKIARDWLWASTEYQILREKAKITSEILKPQKGHLSFRSSGMYYIQGGPKNLAPFFLYALTLPNINRFSKLFHCQNQEKICNVHCYTVWVKKIPPEIFWHFFPNRWEFLVPILHAYYTFLSTLDYKFLFNYLQFWRSYAILSATTIMCSKCPPSTETHAE